ncbi:MAG: HlyD family type I secretion periplasmic adaptor subunit [Candidatus Sericytochromatia bacterium]|nr:HlyD family type I secretion periplasmic adaptor subunit [Candidatus Sericytochromatia bacterium]
MIASHSISARGLEEAALQPPSLVARGIVLSLAALGAVAIGWSAVSLIDIRAKGVGQVVTASQNQVVQNLEGGIVTEILARDGDLVQRGQVLVRLNPKAAKADLSELEVNAVGLLAAGIRLEAEARGASPVFPRALRERAPEVVSNEESLHRQRIKSLSNQLEVIQAEYSEKKAALAELRARVPSIQETLRMIAVQTREMESLVSAGSASPAEIIALRKEAAAQRIQLTIAQESIPGAIAAVSGAERRLREKRATFQAEASEQLSQNRVKFLALQGQIDRRRDQAERTTVVSPVKGVIKTMHVSTQGEVVAPGRTIAEIVPAGDNLLVEARIAPTDIGFVAPGQPAEVRLTAFDHTIYGSLKGRVNQISPDTVRDEQDPKQIYYRVTINTEKSSLTGPSGNLPIIPGMIAEVDIQTGRRTVLEYFLKPLTRARVTALRER